jgi:hypothetical protein
MKKDKKKWEPRAKKVKADLTKLSPAIVNGKCLLKPKSQVVFERTQYGKTALHQGELFNFDEKTITLWDETLGQMFCFGLTDPIRVFARFVEDIIQETESEKEDKPA